MKAHHAESDTSPGGRAVRNSVRHREQQERASDAAQRDDDDDGDDDEDDDGGWPAGGSL